MKSAERAQALQVLDAKVDTVMSGLANLKLTALPPVDAVMRTATPTAEAIVERYQQAHDALVAAPIYLRCGAASTGCPSPVLVARSKAPGVLEIDLICGLTFTVP